MSVARRQYIPIMAELWAHGRPHEPVELDAFSQTNGGVTLTMTTVVGVGVKKRDTIRISRSTTRELIGLLALTLQEDT